MLLRSNESTSSSSSSSDASPRYRDAPLQTISTLPPGIAHIIVNEGAERFSFYGMKAILTVFLTSGLGLGPSKAREYYHAFTMAVYLFPLGGALIAEVWLGKYKTIMYFSVVYCAGHLALSLNESLNGFVLGLGLIAVGAGGIKPCVGACLGDQFGARNHNLLSPTFATFYLAINFGSFAATLVTPALLQHAGSHLAFGVPGILMAVATVTFFLGRYKYAHIRPSGPEFLHEVCSMDGLRALRQLVPLYFFFSCFWSLYDQTGSAWVLQAEKLDRRFLGVDWLPSQVAAINPLLILLLVPVFNGWLLPIPRRLARCQAIAHGDEHFWARIAVPGIFEIVSWSGVRVTPLRKIGVGFLLLAASFAIPLQLEARIAAGEQPSIGWPLLAYLILTSAEILVSITGLEFSYTQAPTKMKSAVMSLYLLSTAIGNLFTVLVNVVITNQDGTAWLSDVDYYRFFVLLMAGVAVGFVPFAAFYRERSFVQGEDRGENLGTSSTSSSSDDRL